MAARPAALFLLQRLLALGAVALLAGVGVFAALAVRDESRRPGLPPAVPSPDGGWYTALAGSGGRTFEEQRSACGHVLDANSLGVAHPVLPCDSKLYLEVNGHTVLTQVIEEGPNVPGRDFALTEALAERLGVRGTTPIRWRYAGQVP